MKLRLAGRKLQVPPVRVRAPGKINLALLVSPLGDDGYHRLVTLFQAVSLFEEVEARQSDGGISISVTGMQADLVPTDETNLAWQAALLLAEHTGVDPDVHLSITKGVPVAGGMAGGSADGAATLVACDALWNTGLSREELLELAGELGSDVPFALLGHTAVGTGRGTQLSAAMARGEFHWALGMQQEGMSTGAVYRAYDEQLERAAVEEGQIEQVDPAGGMPVPGVGAPDWDEAPPTRMMQALLAGDPDGLGRSLVNDLQQPSLGLNPKLDRVLTVAHAAGALGAIVSGSGPTVAALGRSQQHAQALAAAMTAAGVVDSVACVTGGAPGARVMFA